MKTDKYTKIIMTVIAVALVKIAFQDTQTIKPLFAHNGGNDVHKIAICDKSGRDYADISTYRGINYLRITD